MYHQSHVGFVNTHTEGICGHHHAYLIVLPGRLAQLLVDQGYSCMEKKSVDACFIEQSGNVLCFFTITGVDDGRTSHRPQDMHEFIFFVFGGAYDVSKILAFEAHAKHVLAPKGQPFLNIVDHFRSGRGCESEHRHIGEEWAHFGNLQIMRTEVVAPLRDAVGFVDCEQADLHAP